MTTLHPNLHTILTDLRRGSISDAEAAQKLIAMNRELRWTWRAWFGRALLWLCGCNGEQDGGEE